MSALIHIEPPTELRFKGPFTDVVPAELLLRNISEKAVCFKIKTTAPKQYCVRPNCGLIEPGKTAVISVVLQPFELNIREKIKHKFLILSMQAPDKPFESVEELWKNPLTETVYDTKLRCVLEFGNDQRNSKADSGVKHENQRLSDENNHLKAEIERLRRLLLSSSTPELPTVSYLPRPSASGVSFYVAAIVLVVAIVVGVLCGKYLV